MSWAEYHSKQLLLPNYTSSFTLSISGIRKSKNSGIYNKTTIQNNDFTEILAIIHSSQAKALASVNRELIAMYWKIGRIVSEKTATDGWGKSTVSSLASFLQTNFPSSNGFPIKTSGG